MQSNKLSKQKNYKEILKGHNDVILVIEIFDQSRLKSISSDGSFREWDLSLKQIVCKKILLRIPIINENQIENITVFPLTSVIINKDTIIGGYEDGLLVQWNHVIKEYNFFLEKINKKKGEILVFFEGHQKYINSIFFIDNEKFISSSFDKSLRIWDIKNAKTLKVFNFSNDIKSLFYYDSKLFILEGTNKLNIIDSTKDELLSQIIFPESSISCLTINKNFIYLTTNESFLEMYDLADLLNGKRKCLHQVFLNSGWIYTISLYKEWIFLGVDDKSIKIYSQNSLELLEELFGHENLVSCLVFNDFFLFSGSYDHTIRSWDLIEITNRIRERKLMEREELMSRKMEAYNKIMDKTRKKGKNKEKKQEKEEKPNKSNKTKEKASKEKPAKEKPKGKSKEKSKEKKKSTKKK